MEAAGDLKDCLFLSAARMLTNGAWDIAKNGVPAAIAGGARRAGDSAHCPSRTLALCYPLHSRQHQSDPLQVVPVSHQLALPHSLLCASRPVEHEAAKANVQCSHVKLQPAQAWLGDGCLSVA